MSNLVMTVGILLLCLSAFMKYNENKSQSKIENQNNELKIADSVNEKPKLTCWKQHIIKGVQI